MSGSGIYDEHGHLNAIMSIATDRIAQHRAQQKRLQLLTTRLTLTEQLERQMIATWLHDDIAQVLALTKMKLGFIKVASSVDEAQETLQEIGALLGEAIESTRNVNLELSPTILFEQGLVKAVEWAAERASDRYGYEVTVAVRGDIRGVDRDLQMILFQAATEMLANAGKHAAAEHVELTLTYAPDDLRVVVSDDGKGFDLSSIEIDRTGGFGLLNIRERIESVGGTLTIESTPGQGSGNTVQVPVTGQVAPRTAQ